MEALRWLPKSGVDVQEVDTRGAADHPSPERVVKIAAGTNATRFAVAERARAPFPNEIARLDRRSGEHALLVAPFVPTSIGAALTEAGWSWADAEGHFDIRAPGLLLRQRRTSTAPKPTRRTLPQGSGSLAIIRALIRGGTTNDGRAGATALAERAGVSQPRASQVLGQLVDLGLVNKSGRADWRPDREALLDRFLSEYRGPGGPQQLYYSLDPPTDVAVSLSSRADEHNPVVVSADVGPDLIAPWRRPSMVVVYASRGVDLDGLGLVDAVSAEDANVIVMSPADRSVFPEPAVTAEIRGVPVRLADPSQMIWDLQHLGGADRLEAAGLVREWLLARP
jgi:hypothetical protein